jgi:hydrogenase maturation protein HypF
MQHLSSNSLPPTNTDRRRLRVEVRGAVQGVGFRPFVYRLAGELNLAGWVINDTRGVFIEVEGAEADLVRFLERLKGEKPPRALIHNLDFAWLAPAGHEGFEIRHSQEQGAKTVLVLPDIASCADCLSEVANPDDRRCGYPFTNCTNCGPRFTIITALPYDRPNTTMQRFTMCPNCRAEYEMPADRRFHAQPNACPVCGPHLALWSPDGESLIGGSTVSLRGCVDDGLALRRAAEELGGGRILAVKGLGGFHLMADARNAEAIARLRERKARPHKPLALMARDVTQVQHMCDLSPLAEQALASAEAPIVLLPRREGACVADNVAPGNPTLGVMLPYTPLHHLLLRQVDFPVVATSGNLTDEPICTDEHEAVCRLGHIADLFLVHDRPIARHADDSIVWIVRGQPQLLRRARGYAPLPVLVSGTLPTILAVGAHLKNTVALSVAQPPSESRVPSQVFISQHIGDLETAEAMIAFERVIADFLCMYEASPVAIAHDLHPDYLSTQWARSQISNTGLQMENDMCQTEEEKRQTSHLLTRFGHSPYSLLPTPCSLRPVQHHHAHLAACLADCGVSGPALGVTWDGTGYGSDGTVWGGEFLLGDAANFRRVAHLRSFRLPGGEAAVHEPRRVALALLWELLDEAVLDREDLAPVRAFTSAERPLIAQMLKRGLNSPVTTSAGRLFDGVAALVGLHQRVTFEGQAAIALEFASDPSVSDSYPLQGAVQGTLLLDWRPLVEAILRDLQRKVPTGIIAGRFHNSLVEAIVAVAQEVGQPRVALSGGCFQNRWLTERTAARLEEEGFEVLLHRQTPPNDGCISLGQVMVAATQMESD